VLIALILSSVFCLTWAQPYDGIVSGTVSQIDTVANETNNYELRVALGGIVMCNVQDPSLNTWAYLNASDPNYKLTAANLMLAYTTGKRVTISTRNDAGVGCHIHYVSVVG
jgi:hypothetical protein